MFVASVALDGGAIKCRAQALPTAVQALSPARVELYGGYAYFRPLSGTIATRRYDEIQPGGVGSATYFFSRYLGALVEGGAFPRGRNDSIGTIEAGAVLRYPYGRLSPFVHVLGGVVRQRGPLSQPPAYGWGATSGAGLDYVVPWFEDQFAIRVIEADFQYTHVNYGTVSLPDESTGGLGEIKAYRLSAGVVLRFGSSGQHRERPLLYSCAASPSPVFAGDPVTVTGTTGGALMGKPSVYTWATNGGEISATDETAIIVTTGLAAGEYAVIGHIAQGKHAAEVAECTTSFTVQPPEPPTISCSVDPVSVAPGGKATIASQGKSAQKRPLRYSYSASAGDIAGTGAVATLDAGDAPPGPISVECTISDDLGQTATAMTVLNVVAPPLPPVPEPRKLCVVNFSFDRRRPARVEKEAKACLDDVALLLMQEPLARVQITGERTKNEAVGQAAARALNARRYLMREKRIDPARIDLRTGMLGGRTAEIELLPVGTTIHNSDGSGGPQAVPVLGPIKGEDRSPVASPEDRPVGAPSGTLSGVPSGAPVGGGPNNVGTKRASDSAVPAASTGPRVAHPRKHKRRRKAPAAVGTPRTASGAK